MPALRRGNHLQILVKLNHYQGMMDSVLPPRRAVDKTASFPTLTLKRLIKYFALSD